MQKSYTVKAKKALDIANRMSRSLKHNYIGTEHLLIGLLKEGTGVAALVLSENGVDLEKVLELIEELIAPNSDIALLEREGYSPRSRRVLECAQKEAERFGSEQVGTEHILLHAKRERVCGIKTFKYVRGQYSKIICGYPYCDGGRPKQIP